ncbi:MAG TPA: fimbria/pilus periplasmic chaperone [Terriglobales bacterium]
MTSPCFKRTLTVLGGMIGLFAGTCAHASSFSVTPTRIALSGKHSAVTVRLLNTGDDPVTVQARVVTWTLSENKEVYQDSDEVLLNPPIFTLEPDKPQLMRLGLRHPRGDANEVAYRLIVEEVPPPPRPGISLRTILRISIPIFVEQLGAVRKQLDWRAEATPDGMKISATNNGNVHVQIRNLSLVPEGSTASPKGRTVLDYLLPGQTREWVFEEQPTRDALKLSLTAVTDAGNFNASLVPAGR